MAQKDLDQLADILLNKLYRSSETFRELVTSKQVHAFTIDEAEIRKRTRQEVRDIIGFGSTQKLPDEFEKVIKREVPKMVQKFKKSFTHAMERSRTYDIKILGGSSSKSFTVIIESKTGRAKVYNYFRRVKQVAQKQLILALDDVILERGLGEKRLAKDTGKVDKNNNQIRRVGGPFLDIGHDDETTNAAFRSQRAEEILVKFTSDKMNPAVNKYVREIFEDIFVRVRKGPTQKNGKTIFRASIDSSKGNKSKAFEDAEKAGFLQKALDKLIEDQALGFPNAKGSDSPVEVAEKTITNILAGAGNKKSTLKKQKINTKAGKGTSKPKKRKATLAPVVKEKATKLKGRRKPSSKGDRLSLQMLIGPLNNQINEAVRKNMGAPALENRTGRFAGSVKITDINVTAQGFPSIGYTYQRSPYDKFERDTERDPRRLIDRSIREIAAQYAMGRFYTRRQ